MPTKFNKTTLAKEIGIARNTLNKRLNEIAFTGKVDKTNFYEILALLQPEKKASELYAEEHMFDEEYLEASEISAEDNQKRMYKHYVKQYNTNKMCLEMLEQKIQLISDPKTTTTEEQRALPVLTKQYQDLQKTQMQLGDRIDKLSDKVNVPKKVAPAFDFGIEG